MSKKMTAVEFLEVQLIKRGIYIGEELYEQAKAMEKEQKIEFAFDFYYDFSNQLGVPFNLISENRLNAEQYYNETFKSE
jgi:hypothetical protein